MCEGQSAPGNTLVWIGPVDLPESADAYRYCAERAAQIAPRASLEHFLERPADGVSQIVYVRLDRSPPPPKIAELVATYPRARRTLLLGSDCEGESRSGDPWPLFEGFYWHRWNQMLPKMLAPAESRPRRLKRRCVGIVASHLDRADALADWIAREGHTVFWAPRLSGTAIRNVDICLWDDSVAGPASTIQWRARLAEAARAGGHSDRIRHVWLASFPRPEDWSAARRAGVETMISKPFCLRAVRDCLSGSFGPPRDQRACGAA